MVTRMAITPTMDYTKWRTSKSFCLRRNQLAKVIRVSKIHVKKSLKWRKIFSKKKAEAKSVFDTERKEKITMNNYVCTRVCTELFEYRIRVSVSCYFHRTKPKHMHTRIVMALKRLYKNNIYQVLMRQHSFSSFGW